MTKELKESMEKKRKIRGLIAILGLYAVVIGFAVLVIGLFSAQSLDRWLDEEHMSDPSMPYNEFENATYTITPNDLDELLVMSQDMAVIGVVFLGLGVAIIGTMIAVMPSKKEQHKLICPNIEAMFWGNKVEPIYCPVCGLKLSLLDRK